MAMAKTIKTMVMKTQKMALGTALVLGIT